MISPPYASYPAGDSHHTLKLISWETQDEGKESQNETGKNKFEEIGRPRLQFDERHKFADLGWSRNTKKTKDDKGHTEVTLKEQILRAAREAAYYIQGQ